jgi:AAA family ATPase
MQDPALLRPGRLDRILYVGPPDREARKRIFEIRLGRMRVDPNINLDMLADLVSTSPAFMLCIAVVLITSTNSSMQTDGCSGAEIVSVCQNAAVDAINQHAIVCGNIGKDEGPERIAAVHFVNAAVDMPRGITSEMLQVFDRWKMRSMNA